MSDIERRLHHAARELRSVEIEPPRLAPFAMHQVPTVRRSGLAGRVPALVMPVLFVLGGLAVIAGGLGRSADPPAAVPAAPTATVPGQVAHPGTIAATAVAAPPATPRATTSADTGGAALTARQEITLIAALAPGSPVRPSSGSPAEQLRTLAQTYH